METTCTVFTNTDKPPGTCALYIRASIVKFVLCLDVAAHAPMSIEDFSVHIENLLAKDKHGFSKEYKVNTIILTTLHIFKYQP